MGSASWGGPRYPNASTAADPIKPHALVCPPAGCLFDVVDDPAEVQELSARHPAVVARLAARLAAEAATIWSVPHRDDPACMEAARSRYGSFLGPWREV